jgi:hypothetical protein
LQIIQYRQHFQDDIGDGALAGGLGALRGAAASIFGVGAFSALRAASSPSPWVAASASFAWFSRPIAASYRVLRTA